MLVPISHSRNLYEEYGGTKTFTLVEGDHNSTRSDLVYNTVANFLAEHLFRPSDQTQAYNESLYETNFALKNKTHRRKYTEVEIIRSFGDRQYIFNESTTPESSPKKEKDFYEGDY